MEYQVTVVMILSCHVISRNYDLTKTSNINTDTQRSVHMCVSAHTCYVTAWADECLCAEWTSVRDVSGQRMNVFLIRVFLLELGQMAY